MTDMKAIAPGAIEGYRGELNSGIDLITDGLNALCRDITNVNYGGRNAFKFKTEASQLANDLSTRIYSALEELGRSVATATTALSDSFGGSAITVDLRNNTITAADPGADTDDGVASLSGLQTLSNQVDAAFETINSGVKMVANMPPNSPAGWMGDRRNATEQHVGEFVGLATTSCNTTKTSLTSFIATQISSLDGQ